VSRCTTSRESPGTRSNAKSAGIAATLVTARTLDFAALPAQVALVLDRGFETRDVDRAELRVDVEAYAPLKQVCRHDVRLPKELDGGNTVACCRPHMDS
jgi:hypothetical protein